ncbi:methionine--tRNA ligase [Candidatus Microgenomates bacterium]|nr:MAG: methionine--tRNA ligase [Candidatus Microgenomates bacterium]
MNKFYLTTAIPYVNAKPHIGHALEFVQADVVKRYQQILGKETVLLSGGDENSLKNVQAAEEENVSVQELVDKNSQLFADLAKKLNVNFDIFQKGSNKNHYQSSQKLWELCFNNGDIYRKEYSGLYCVGCETFYEESELDECGECFEHPGKKLEKVTEENWFFKLSKYQDQLIKILESDQIKITPQSRKNEALAFIKQGLEDISISRSNDRAKNWGVPVPNDPNQRMYVWFDALNIYQSGVGFGWNEEEYKKWWPADLHIIGKGILRFHAVYWPAFILSAKLDLPKAIFVHGYLTINGQKMSKTLGNVIDPIEMVDKYGLDALRYYLLKEIPSTGDGDFSEERLKTVYNSDLANGLGNLVARVAKLCEKNNIEVNFAAENLIDKNIEKTLQEYKFNETLSLIWLEIAKADKKINETKPWELSADDSKIILQDLIKIIQTIAYNLRPFLPETAGKIKEQFKGPKISSQPPLFPRLA